MDNNEQQLAAMDNNGLQSVVLHASVMPFYIIHHEATSGYDISELFATHREIEDEDVGRVPHCLVQQNHKDNEKIADEADDDDKGKEDGHDDGHDCHQGLQLLQVYLLLPLLNHYCGIHLMNTSIQNFRKSFISEIFVESWQRLKVGLHPTEIKYFRNFLTKLLSELVFSDNKPPTNF